MNSEMHPIIIHTRTKFTIHHITVLSNDKVHLISPLKFDADAWWILTGMFF